MCRNASHTNKERVFYSIPSATLENYFCLRPVDWWDFMEVINMSSTKENIHVATETIMEAPCLELTHRKVIADMETETVCFSARGRTIQEAKEGILFLLDCQKSLKETKDKS